MPPDAVTTEERSQRYARTRQAREGTVPTVFVVDDDSNVRSALARLIRCSGCRSKPSRPPASSWGTNAQTVRPASSWMCDSLGENGLQVQEALQAAPRRPPIIFLTGYGTLPMCVQAMKGGAVDFLQKPVDDDALHAAIATALAQDARTRTSQQHHAELHQRFATLTPRERDVMGLVITRIAEQGNRLCLGHARKDHQGPPRPCHAEDAGHVGRRTRPYGCYRGDG